MSEARPIRDRVETVIFGTETRAGNLFDLTLLILILASVFVVMLDSVEAYHAAYGDVFRWVELGFTLYLRLSTSLDFGAYDVPLSMPSASGAWWIS